MRRYLLPLLALAPIAIALFWFLMPGTSTERPPPRAARSVLLDEPPANEPVHAGTHGRLEGRVLGADGSPAGGAEVRALEAERVVATARSDDGGAWRLADLPGGEYVLLARRGDAASDALGPIPLFPGETLAGLDLQLAGASSIAGAVRDAAAGSTIDGARIEIAGLAGQTDRAGRFRIVGLPAGPAVLRASAPGYETRTQSIDLGGSVSGVEIGLRRGARVSGRVLGADGPVQGARIHVPGASDGAISVFDGGFALDVPAGQVELEAIATDGRRGRSAPVELGPGVHAEGIEIRIERAAQLAGTVLDAAGAPAAGAQVHAASLEGALLATAKAGADGRFSLDGLPAGLLRVVARLGAATGTSEPIAVAAADIPEVQVRLGAGTLAGRVEDTGGAGIAGARLFAWPDGTPRAAAARALADADGRFRFEGLPEGPLRVETEHAEAQAEARGVFAGATDLRLVIGSGALVGRVLVDGSPATDFQISAAAIDPGRTSGAARSVVSVDGTFRLPLPPGRYEVRAVAGGASAEPQLARVPGAGDSAEALFDLRSGAAVEGVVLDADTREPVAGARISTSRTRTFSFAQAAAVPSGPQALSGADGRFRLSGLPTDRRIPVFAWKPGYQSMRPLVVQALEGATERLEILLVPGGEGESAFGGIGLTLGRWKGALVAAEVIEGGPGWEAGIRRGDHIVAVDGDAVGPNDLRSVVERVRGPVGTPVLLDLVRDGTWFRAAPLRAELRF